ncbi:MAG: amino acid deaminase, partial [Alphaproteobacteria bacterium]
MNRAAIEALEAQVVDDTTKGYPDGVAPVPLGKIGGQGWNLLREDLPLPVAVLKASAVENNSRWMQRFIELSGAVLCPHGKTTMSPQLFQRQLDDGAWGITMGTVDQVRICRGYGIDRIILANQLVGRQGIGYILDELHEDPDFDFYCLVDSVQGVERLAAAVAAHALQRPLQVLLEGGIVGGRTGCRSIEDAVGVAEAVRAAGSSLVLRGVEGFEGLVTGADVGERERKVSAFLDFLVGLAVRGVAEDWFGPGPIILTAGGSAFYD